MAQEDLPGSQQRIAAIMPLACQHQNARRRGKGGNLKIIAQNTRRDRRTCTSHGRPLMSLIAVKETLFQITSLLAGKNRVYGIHVGGD